MSGVLSLVREVIGLYGWQQARSLEVFWICARIAFIVSAVMVYRIQNKKISELEFELVDEKDKRGRPMPMVACKDFNINGYTSESGRPLNDIILLLIRPRRWPVLFATTAGTPCASCYA